MLLHEIKDIDEGFKSAARGVAFAALAATAMSGTYGYDKLLRDRDPDDVEVSQEATAAYHKKQQSSKARLLALAKRTKAKRMNPKASKQENMVQSGSYPSDAVAGSGSTTHGSRYQASQSSVNEDLSDPKPEYWVTKFEYWPTSRAWYSNRMMMYGKQTYSGDSGKPYNATPTAEKLAQKYTRKLGIQHYVVQQLKGQLVSTLDGSIVKPLFNPKAEKELT